MISRTSTFVALLLLALWLPATQHCGLEAAGVLASEVDCHDSAICSDQQGNVPCNVDSCQSVEDAGYKSIQNNVQLTAPIAVTCLCCLNVISPETIIVSMISPAQTDAPPELAPSWQFVRRSAPPSRAPSVVIA